MPPAFNDLIIYQLHVGTYDISPGNPDGCFFDVIQRVPYLAALGVNAIELLPIQEFPTAFSMGYNGTDLYSPENEFGEADETMLQRYADLTNADSAERRSGRRMRASTCSAAATVSCARWWMFATSTASP